MLRGISDRLSGSYQVVYAAQRVVQQLFHTPISSSFAVGKLNFALAMWLGSGWAPHVPVRLWADGKAHFHMGPLDQDICHSSITSKWLHGTYSSQEATAYPQGDGRLQHEKQCFCQACPLLHFSITFTNALLRAPVVKIHFSNISNYFKIIVPFWEGILSC